LLQIALDKGSRRGMSKKTVPCWLCKGTGIAEEGERVDVGLGTFCTAQVSADWDCGLCNGTGQIVLGSKAHNLWRKNVMNVGRYKPPVTNLEKGQ
jgi:DnaJ-class molecular chaperone